MGSKYIMDAKMASQPPTLHSIGENDTWNSILINKSNFAKKKAEKVCTLRRFRWILVEWSVAVCAVPSSKSIKPERRCVFFFKCKSWQEQLSVGSNACLVDITCLLDITCISFSCCQNTALGSKGILLDNIVCTVCTTCDSWRRGCPSFTSLTQKSDSHSITH